MSNSEHRPLRRQIKPQVPELDFRRIEYTDEQVAHARGIVASSSKESHGRTEAEDAQVLLEHLGLMPGQEAWYTNGSQE